MRRNRSILCIALLSAAVASAKLATFSTGFGTLAKPGQGTMAMAQGDINGDGLVDWVVEGSFNRPVVVMNKRFGDAQSISIQSSVYSTGYLALGDADGDKKLDILVCGEADYHADRKDSTTMSVVFAGSDLGFGDSVDIVKSTPVTCGGFLDVDRDGDLDIIAVNGSLKWYENKNSGKSWTAHAIEAELDSGFYSGEGDDVWLQVADFSMDSATDFVIGYRGDMGRGRLLFYRNNANGTFTKSVIAGNFSSQCGAAGDIDLNGMPDLLTGAVIFLNDHGNFTRDSLPNPPEHLVNGEAMGDVNSDGYPDIVAGVFDDGVFLWQSTGKRAYTRSLFQASAGAKLVAIADADGDHFNDITALYESAGTLTYARNMATHAFAAETTLITVKGLNCFDLADLNKDGLTDIVTSPFKVFHGSVLTLSTTLMDTILVPVDSSTLSANAFQFSDFDKDGALDIAYGMGWARQADPSHFTFTRFYDVNREPAGIADLDGNGTMDFIGRYYSSALTPAKSYLIGMLNTGTGTIGRLDTLFSVCRVDPPFPMAMADVDRDGDVDIITVSGEKNMENEYYGIYGKNKGNGEFDSTFLDFGNASNLTQMTPFDLDKDGWIDLLLASGSLMVSRNQNGSFGKAVTISAGGADNNEITAGDIDRDNKNDVVVYSGTTKDLSWVSQDTAFGFISRHSISTGKVTGNIRVMDFDNDGWQDVLCMQADKLVLYRNLLGIPPAKPISFPTRADFAQGNAGSAEPSLRPRMMGKGRFLWTFPRGLRASRLDLFRLNGSKVPARIEAAAHTCIVDLECSSGLVVWCLRDKQGKSLGRGLLTVTPSH